MERWNVSVASSSIPPKIRSRNVISNFSCYDGSPNTRLSYLDYLGRQVGKDISVPLVDKQTNRQTDT